MLGDLDTALLSGESVTETCALLLAHARGLPPDRLHELMFGLDPLIRRYPAERVGELALLAGALVEIGGDPQDFPRAVLDQLVELLDRIDADDDHAPPAHFYLLEQAATTCLARSPELRQTLPQVEAIRARLRRPTERHGLLGKMVQVLDDEPVIALHAASGRALQLRMSGVVDNYQLVELLMAALAPLDLGVTAPDPDAMVEHAIQLATWHGLLAPDDDHRLWGESLPAEIPRFEDTRLVIVGPTEPVPGWHPRRLFPAMAGTMTFERELPGRELVARIMATAQ